MLDSSWWSTNGSSIMSNVSQFNDSAVSDLNYVDYGVLWLLDLLYLILLSIVGTIGNLLIICSIIYQRRVNKNGNIFIINLAMVDLISNTTHDKAESEMLFQLFTLWKHISLAVFDGNLKYQAICMIVGRWASVEAQRSRMRRIRVGVIKVTGFVIPIGIANVITGRDVLSDVACAVAGFLLCVSCACSISNLACIAFNRYWCVARHESYRRIFTRKVLYVMVMMNYIWGILLVLPTVLGWSKQHYDVEVMFCTFNLGQSISYNIFLMGFGIALPIIITAISYWKLFAFVSKSSTHRRRWSSDNTCIPSRAEQNKLKKERNLARTLLVTVLALLLCFLPFSIMTLVNQTSISPTVSKMVGRLILTNFTMNFTIYGAMNPIYRKGYIALIRCMFCLEQSRTLPEMMTDCSAPSDDVKIKMNSLRKSTNHANLHCTVRGKEMQAHCGH